MMSGQAFVKATGKRILVVQDGYVIAESFVRELQRADAAVFGPVPTTPKPRT